MDIWEDFKYIMAGGGRPLGIRNQEGHRGGGARPNAGRKKVAVSKDRTQRLLTDFTTGREKTMQTALPSLPAMSSYTAGRSRESVVFTGHTERNAIEDDDSDLDEFQDTEQDTEEGDFDTSDPLLSSKNIYNANYEI